MEEIKTTYQGFAEIACIIREGKMGQLHIGDTISTRHTLRDRLLWRIIGINADTALDGTPETVTVMLCNPPIWCSFDGGRKGFPFGCNEWEPSDMRARLQGDVLDGFDAEDRAGIVPVRRTSESGTRPTSCFCFRLRRSASRWTTTPSMTKASTTPILKTATMKSAA